MRRSNFLRNFFYEPLLANLHPDDPNLLSTHKKIISKKPLLRSAFEAFYIDMAMLCDCYFDICGDEIELGSGVGFFKKLRKNLKTSDIRNNDDHDLQINALKMNLKNESVRCLYAVNVFHHLSDPELFFSEVCRVLKVGGGLILIEPHIGFFSAFLHRHLHKSETFLPRQQSWKNKDISGPLSGANQALAYIIFERDYNLFNKKYGAQLNVIHKRYALNSFRYFFSGGVNFKQLAPSFMIRPLALLENILKPFAFFWSLHQVIVIKRIS